MNIIYDLFPSHFAIAPESFDGDVDSQAKSDGVYYIATARVLITENDSKQRFVVVAQDTPDGAQIIFREKITNFVKPKKQTEEHTATTLSGKRLAFSKDSNCGCGSRLRSWNPYRTLRAISDFD